VREPGGAIVGLLVREQQAVAGRIEAEAVEVAEGLFRVTLRVRNLATGGGNRDQALLRSLASTHAILSAREGEFVSLIDPPGRWREAAAGCRNVGAWPVLAGEPGRLDTMLSAPIILDDYPRIAPESPGELFDATEIDEILTLRILTLTEEEKRAVAAVDPRAAALLARTEALAGEPLLGLHGTIRDIRPEAGGEGS
jgi:hydrogenase maturation protease